MDTPENQPTPDQTQPTGTPPVPPQAPAGTGSAIMGNQPPVQPTTPQPNAAPNPVTAQPQRQTPAAQNPIDDHAKLYKKLLLGLVPPTRYVDPQGNVQEVPQTKVSMGKTILASVLAGMFATPNVYRQTPYGSVIDSSATSAAAMANGAAIPEKQNAAAQAQSDLIQTKKLQSIQNSIQQVHLMAASAQQKHQDLQGVIDSNLTALTDFKAYDDTQSDPAKKNHSVRRIDLPASDGQPALRQGKDDYEYNPDEREPESL